MECRAGCGACCIAPSIVRPFPNAPAGKAAGQRCPNLDDAYRCRIWGRPEYPAACRGFRPEASVCGDSREAAMALLTALEAQTRP